MNINELKIGLAYAASKLSWGIEQPRWNTNVTATDFSIVAARNEVVGFQIRLAARDPFVIVLDGTNWLHPLGLLPRLRVALNFHGFPKDAVEMLNVGYIEGDDHRSWMDTLSSCGWSEAEADRPESVYVRIHVPAELPSGVYEGQITIYGQQGFGDEEKIWQGKVILEVADVLLPDPRDWSFHLVLWLHCTGLARYYRVPMWSESHFELIDRYYARLAAIGQKAVTVIGAEIPWAGQRCFRDTSYPSYLFEHSMIEVTRSSDGQLHYDFTTLERVLSIAGKYGINQEIDVFGLLHVWQDEDFGFTKIAPDAPDAMRVRCYCESTDTYSYLRTAAELRQYLRAIYDWFKAKGFLSLVRVTADEPADLEMFNKYLAFVKETVPEFRYKVYINHIEFIREPPDDVINAVPMLNLACQDLQLTSHYADSLHDCGGRYAYYIWTQPPRPNTLLHSPLVESQFLGWLTHYLKLDGFERWAFCLWPADPWRRLSWRAPIFAAGEMNFVMPGEDGQPVDTLRYETLRAGIQNYELIQMVQHELGSEAQTVIDQAFAHIIRAKSLAEFAYVATTPAEDLYSLDPADYQKAKSLLLNALMKKRS